jgi:NAD+ kinase
VAKESPKPVSAPVADQIRRVLMVAHPAKPGAAELSEEIVPWLEGRGLTVDLELDMHRFSARRDAEIESGVEAVLPDLVVTLGGDGTMLGAVRAFRDSPVPTLGINLGRVGFLASVPEGRWRETLEEVLAGQGVPDPRMRIKVEIHAGGRVRDSVALNDVCIQRGSHQGMMTASLWVGDDWVTNYRADGVVVATSTGSTAYSLSAGGPILAPTLSALVATPLCSQGLSNRPIVLDPEKAVRLRVERASGVVTIVLDGQGFFRLHQGEWVEMHPHPVPYPLLSLPGLDPYRRLRERLGWGGSGEVEQFPSEGWASPPSWQASRL